MPFGDMSLGEDARVWLEKYFAPRLVAQATAYFVSHDMSKSGEIYSVGGGRVSCISYINNDGYFDRELTPEIVELSGTDML